MVTPLARRTALSRLALCCSLMATAFATCVAAAADEKPSPLPLKKVVLFNSGVGFFEHKADVEGDAKVDLKFNVGDINDLLKSMVLQDLGGGKVSTVTYGSMDPITKTLKTFAIDLTNNPTMADLLRQVRGETVDVDRFARPQPAQIAIGFTSQYTLPKGRTHLGAVTILRRGSGALCCTRYRVPESAHRRRPAQRAAGHRGTHQAHQ